MQLCVSFFKDCIYLLLERREGREKETERNIDLREKHQLPLAGKRPSQGLNHSLDMCPDRQWNQWPCTLWYDAQPTEPHQSRLRCYVNYFLLENTQILLKIVYDIFGKLNYINREMFCEDGNFSHFPLFFFLSFFSWENYLHKKKYHRFNSPYPKWIYGLILICIFIQLFQILMFMWEAISQTRAEWGWSAWQRRSPGWKVPGV